MKHPFQTPDDAVYQRTHLGRRIVVTDAADLDADARRLLLMVNGHTPMADLARLAPQLSEPRIAKGLLLSGMIEPCSNDRA